MDYLQAWWGLQRNPFSATLSKLQYPEYIYQEPSLLSTKDSAGIDLVGDDLVQVTKENELKRKIFQRLIKCLICIELINSSTH